MSLRFRKVDPRAVAPVRAHATDAGSDVWVIEKLQDDGVISKYETGIQVACPPGCVLQLVARSSLHKLGYMLANGVGIIDSGYRGNVNVVLYKFRPDAADLELPCKIAQLLAIPLLNKDFVEVEELDATERGSGGFGSTDAEKEGDSVDADGHLLCDGQPVTYSQCLSMLNR